MLIVPAIDLKDGKCVRLQQGDMNRSTVFSDDPVSMVKKWRDLGARRLHIVDLDGAIEGQPVNATLISRMTEAAQEMPVQVGGGIRSAATANAYLSAGVSFVIIGTQAVRTPELIDALCAAHPQQIIVGLDSRDGMVSVDGWVKDSSHELLATAQRFSSLEIAAFIHTDIAHDGMLDGVNINSTAALAQATGVPVFASGGVKDLSDIKKVLNAVSDGVTGVIVGRSIYEGTLNFAAAQALADEAPAS